MKNSPIGILDSGIGGVTVLKEIIKLLPNEDYIYYSDSLHAPYGEKSKEDVINYVDSIVKFLISKNCKLIIVACNTATAFAIKEIRDKYPNIDIIGIEPAYKMIHDFSYNKKTLVMATSGTIHSEKFLNLYHQYDNDNTILLSCEKLATLIENDDDGIEDYLREILSKEKIEAVVLGCTHYPLVKDIIEKIIGPVVFYDGGKGVAQHVSHILDTKELHSDKNSGMIYFIDSSLNEHKKERFFQLLQK